MNDFISKVSQKIGKLSDEQLERLITDLQSENNALSSVLESLSTGLVIVDGSWRLLQMNKAAERCLPLKVRVARQSQEQKGESQPVWSLIDDTFIAEFLRSCASEQKTNVSEEFSLSKDDKVLFFTIAVMPLIERRRKDDSESRETRIVGSIISVDDITEKRQQEILLHRMESLASLTSLAASVAHEIKNPLGAISIHIQLLQKVVRKARAGDGMLPAPKFMEEYLDVINGEIESLNKIVVDFLFAVRPVQATMELAEPDALVEKTVSFFLPEFESKCVNVVLRLCKASPRLLIDEKLFREVIVNLAQNALAAIQERFPVREVPKEEHSGCTTYRRGELVLESFVKNDEYVLTVADNGCGMDSKTSSRIFEPYYTTKSSGTGLGLTTVYKIIKEFRGGIDVKSVPGHGTVFTIKLPVPQRNTQLLEDKSKGGE